MKASVEFVVVVLSLCSVVIDCYKAARVILLAEFENTAMAASCPRTVVLWRRSRSAPGTLKMLNFDKFYQEDMRGQVPDVLLVLLKYLLSASIRKCPPPPPPPPQLGHVTLLFFFTHWSAACAQTMAVRLVYFQVSCWKQASRYTARGYFWRRSSAVLVSYCWSFRY